MSNNKQWFQIADATTIDSPALLVFTERVQQNIQTAIEMTGDSNRLRPHVKTHKCAEITRMMIAAGISKFKCATIAEAEMLGMANAADVLLAYQPVGPKLQRFIQLIKKYPGTVYSCLTDNVDSATMQSKAFAEAGLTVPVYIDLNVGMNRTGILPEEGALELYRFCAKAPGILIKGLHAYDGHITNSNFKEREKEANAVFLKVELLVEKIKAAQLPVPAIILGGSPTFSIHCKRPEVECSPGTFIYWDKSYLVNCPEQKFLPAAILITRVVSLPGTGLVCTDLGHKSVAAENERSKRVFFPEHEHLTVLSQSEEHLLLKNQSSDIFKPGDLLYAIPWHVCPTVALYDTIIIVEKGKVVTTWKNIARDRKISV
ncbi:D-TA family PLP-dependent enzyme [Ferruginibacter sp. SUN106]|uniref:D-TA family PLP-dependent enzyme n=1 Tax=Ferruginibacter sp. SUN106 TaxID=2978348 RepID=UPI003D360642